MFLPRGLMKKLMMVGVALLANFSIFSSNIEKLTTYVAGTIISVYVVHEEIAHRINRDTPTTRTDRTISTTTGLMAALIATNFAAREGNTTETRIAMAATLALGTAGLLKRKWEVQNRFQAQNRPNN